MTTPLTPQQRGDIRLRGARPSQYTAATIRADYTALLGEINRQAGERSKVRYLLADLVLGKTTLDQVVEELALAPEIESVRFNNEANAAFHERLTAPMFDDTDYDEEP